MEKAPKLGMTLKEEVEFLKQHNKELKKEIRRFRRILNATWDSRDEQRERAIKAEIKLRRGD